MYNPMKAKASLRRVSPPYSLVRPMLSDALRSLRVGHCACYSGNPPEKDEGQTNPECFIPLGKGCERSHHIIEYIVVSISITLW